MCRFVTATLPVDADHAALEAIAQRHGRRLMPISNPSIDRQIGPELRHYLTTPGHCDCDVPLGRRPHERAKDPDEAAQRLRRKGWSAAKIERALAQQQDRRAQRVVESTAPWLAFIRDMLTQTKNTRLGLLLHYYSGALDADIVLSARESVPLPLLSEALLEGLRQDVLYEFRR